MRLVDYLKPELVKLGLEGRKAKEILPELAALVARGTGADARQIEAALRERERMGSTAVGGGVAIPHAKCDALSEMVVAIGVHREGVPFGAPDRRPVNLFVVLLGPSGAADEHLRLLSGAARLFRSQKLKSTLLGAVAAEDVLAALRAQAEEVSEAPPGVSKEAGYKLIIVMLEDERLAPEVMEYFVEAGLEEAVVIDCSRVTQVVARSIPLFAGFTTMMGGENPYGKVLLAGVDAARLDRVTGELLAILRRGGAQSSSVFTVEAQPARQPTQAEK